MKCVASDESSLLFYLPYLYFQTLISSFLGLCGVRDVESLVLRTKSWGGIETDRTDRSMICCG